MFKTTSYCDVSLSIAVVFLWNSPVLRAILGFFGKYFKRQVTQNWWFSRHASCCIYLFCVLKGEPFVLGCCPFKIFWRSVWYIDSYIFMVPEYSFSICFIQMLRNKGRGDWNFIPERGDLQFKTILLLWYCTYSSRLTMQSLFKFNLLTPSTDHFYYMGFIGSFFKKTQFTFWWEQKGLHLLVIALKTLRISIDPTRFIYTVIDM